MTSGDPLAVQTPRQPTVHLFDSIKFLNKIKYTQIFFKSYNDKVDKTTILLTNWFIQNNVDDTKYVYEYFLIVQALGLKVRRALFS